MSEVPLQTLNSSPSADFTGALKSKEPVETKDLLSFFITLKPRVV